MRSVPPEASAADLSTCVRDRLGLASSEPFYVAWEKGDHAVALPLVPSLPVPGLTAILYRTIYDIYCMIYHIHYTSSYYLI